MFVRFRHKRNVYLIAKRLALFSKTLLFPTMDPELSKLLIGLDISISRSDGRIHSATVKDVSVAKSSIKVEWTENGTNKGKEVDLNEINELNSELMKHLHSLRQEEPKTSPAHVVAPTKIPAKNKKGTELLLRSSRIPACAEPHPKDSSSGEAASRRMTTRQTCLFQRPDHPPVILATLPEDGLTKSLQKSALPKSAGLPQKPEVTKVMSKRLSLAKYPESQKKGKFGDAVGRSKPFHQMIEEYRENLEKVPMSLSDPVKADKICVCVRKRPLNKKEVVKKEIDVVTIPGNGVLLLHEPKQKVDLTKYLENQTFRFDYSFDEDVTNDTVYRFTAKPLVKTIFEGGMATCFAYGQTGSGKTHTMGGNFSGKTQNSSNGIYALAAQDVFTFLGQKRYADMDLCPYVTFFEIYNGKVFDLLNKKAMLRVLEDERQQVNVVGLLEVPVLSVEDVIKLIERGSACRTSGQTFANASSSRSHAILQVILRRRDTLHGKFSLVDLAGNERGNDIKSNDRHTIVETAEINRSLLALKECIRSLGQNSEHIPFRMSKLTQVLRDSFIGENSRTCMIAMISPGMSSCEYTLNTLRYANRVKELNGVSKDASVENGTKYDSEEEESVPLEFDAISQVAEMEVQFFESSKVFLEVIRSMESPTFDVVERHSEIDLVMKKLQESYQALTLAIEAERKIRMIHEV